MKIEFHKHFTKRYKKIPSGIRRQFEERLFIFEENSFHPLLNNHPLTGDRKGQWSINVTGDWRAIYVFKDEDTIVFIDIDTHSNLYK
ncbi:type II toxin-antitoxin system mRNA interferase toxin, RelE/StbE family [Patescibacteria group bacterium]|nr:type II toxin-antitoxin system mRNA interferase toxin, RelE/StbE family [Patescibacteria group bacterium]MBU4298532.1 type II toxin-antitoxin system mRNA interferase toxin, RelE/StbE family [Patescibacteria group bacterium]